MEAGFKPFRQSCAPLGRSALMRAPSELSCQFQWAKRTPNCAPVWCATSQMGLRRFFSEHVRAGGQSLQLKSLSGGSLNWPKQSVSFCGSVSL